MNCIVLVVPEPETVAGNPLTLTWRSSLVAGKAYMVVFVFPRFSVNVIMYSVPARNVPVLSATEGVHGGVGVPVVATVVDTAVVGSAMLSIDEIVPMVIVLAAALFKPPPTGYGIVKLTVSSVLTGAVASNMNVIVLPLVPETELTVAVWPFTFTTSSASVAGNV